MRLRIPRAAITLGAVLALAGCAPERAAVLGPEPGEQTNAPASSAGRFLMPPTHLVLLSPDIQDPWSLLRDYGVEFIVSLLSGGLAGVLGDLDIEAMLADPRIRAVQINGATAMSEPSDLTMAFFEGTFDDSTIGDRVEFIPLRLDEVHALARGRGIRIAVLDTGVDPAHPHLSDRVEMFDAFGLPWPEEVANGVDEDGDGEIDEAFGHGTHVSGIIATVAPEATILPIRVLDSDGVGTAYELALGIRNAIDRGAHVINLSVSVDEDATVLRSILEDARARGITIVAAAGNTGGRPTLPAAYDFVLGTAATGLDPEQIADFSARGLEIELAAPGTSVLSSFPGGGWALATGSSMSAAITSGAFAVVRSSDPNLDATRAQHRISASALTISPIGSVRHGRVDILRALNSGTRPDRRLLQPTTLNGAH